MPVLVRTRQPAHLQTENDADMIEADFSEQTLKAEPAFHALAALTLVLIDQQHAFLGPPQRQGSLSKRVLPSRRFAMFLDLLHRRLADINDRLTLEVPSANLARNQRRFGTVRRRRRGR